TTDLIAFDLYNRANNLLMLRLSSALKANLLQAVDLLNQAVARDPSFLQAYCQLACAHDQLYFLGFDHTPARLALAEAAIERAVDLDPRNTETLQQIAISYGVLRRYAEDKAVLDRALTVDPNDIITKVALAAVQFHSKADTAPLHQTIDSIRNTDPAALPNIANDWLSCALAERDIPGARNALDAFGDMPLTDYAVHLNRPLIEGVLARMTKRDDEARAAFTAARTEQEKIVWAQPDYGPALCVLGLIDAALGRKDEALREARRAVEVLPVDKDAINGPLMVEYLAMIAAWAGDKDLACEQLAIAVRPPSTVSYGQLRLLPFWDPLRGDPRFEKILASVAPKEEANK